MTIYTGDTITVNATLDGSLSDPDSQLIRFFDAAGRMVGKYTNPTGSGTAWSIAHQSHEFDQFGTWLCHWQVTKGTDVESEQLEITVAE